MLNPGDYSLCNRAISTAVTGEVQSTITGLDGITAATIECQFTATSGGTSCKVWVQVSLDNGQSWVDIACFAFTTASATKIINLSGLTQVTTAFTPSDGAMADNTYQDGCLGSRMRAKLSVVGSYTNTNLAVRVSAR